MALAEYNIIIGAEQKKALTKHIWSETFIRAHLLRNGRRVPIRLRYRGGHTRSYPKKSYEMRIGGKTYHFNAEVDDPSLIRNALSFRFFESIGVPSPSTRHCTLRINGRSEGVYLLIEAVNRVFFRRRRIPVASLVYADNDSANFSLISPQTGKRKKSLFEGYRLMIGSASSRSKVRRLIGGLHRLRKERRVAFLTRKLNTSNYLRWLAGAVLTNNYDGFEQNYALYEHGATGKYHMIPWDYEGTWGRNCYGKRCPSDLVRIAGYNALTEALLADADIRQRYRALLADLLETKFTEQAIMPIVSKLHGNIADAVHRDHTRSWAYSVFEQEPELIRKFIRERRDIVSRDLNKL